MIVIVITLVVVIGSLIITYHVRKPNRLPNGPYGLPIVGYLPFIDARQPEKTFAKLCQKYGSIYSVRLGNVLTVVISDTNMLRTVFSKSSTTARAPLYLTHGIMNGYGLICSDGDLWKDQRKLAINCLKQFNLDTIADLLNESVTEFINNIKNDHLNKPCDIRPILGHYISNLISCLVYGKKWRIDDPQWLHLISLQKQGLKYMGVGAVLNFLPWLRFLLKAEIEHLPHFKRIIKFIMDGKQETHEMLEEFYRQEVRNGEKLENAPYLSAIQYFIREKRRVENDRYENRAQFYTKQQFYHFVADLFGAGTDTTLATLNWIFVFLIKYPTMQQKCFDELNAIGHLALDKDMNRFNYLQAFVAEVQRLKTIVPMGIPHGTTSDIVLDQYTIPKNTMIMPFQRHIHLDGKYWCDPLVFRPERFLDADGTYRKNPNLIQFQFGKRVCIGEQLSKLILITFVSETIRKFKISALNGSRIRMDDEPSLIVGPQQNQFVFQLRL